MFTFFITIAAAIRTNDTRQIHSPFEAARVRVRDTAKEDDELEGQRLPPRVRPLAATAT